MPFGWSLTDLLLADVFHALAGEAHPSHPRAGTNAKATAQADAIARLHAQRERLAAGKAAEST